MTSLGLLGVGVLVLVGSTVPFVPTGELVSAAAALGSFSWSTLTAVYVVTLTASVVGDSVLLLAARTVSRRIGPRQRNWLASRRLAPAVARAQAAVGRHAPTAVVTGRLIPGGRAPVIIALGLQGYPLGRFAAVDVLAAGLWAGVYVSLGAVGTAASGHPLLGTAVAVAAAVALGLALSRLNRRSSSHQGPSTTPRPGIRRCLCLAAPGHVALGRTGREQG